MHNDQTATPSHPIQAEKADHIEQFFAYEHLLESKDAAVRAMVAKEVGK